MKNSTLLTTMAVGSILTIAGISAMNYQINRDRQPSVVVSKVSSLTSFKSDGGYIRSYTLGLKDGTCGYSMDKDLGNIENPTMQQEYAKLANAKENDHDVRITGFQSENGCLGIQKVEYLR